jgi:hypothetical protein
MCIVLNQPDEQDKVEASYRSNLAASMKTSGAIMRTTITGADITGYPKHPDPRAIYWNAIK